ncbi:MAG: AAA family ATPase [Candidatus Eremiobacteraeota bacterium]|nr:AAA family ATPase [Candidatus Eremiobacteraeota bacterium]
MSRQALFGREHEARAIEDHLAAVAGRGSALLVRGDAGIGKTAILDFAKSLAADRGMTVLAATGTQSETNLPFSGLHELLRPVLNRVDHLVRPQQDALAAAFGLTNSAAADLFLIALGALDLLADVASKNPLLLVVDDLQWLDQSSADVLAFIARRLDFEPIVLLIGSRDVFRTGLSAVVPEMRIEALDDAASESLLDALDLDLSPSIRKAVLHEAAGNPLALVELPKAIASEIPGGGVIGEHLPLTARLERAFASQIRDLPGVCRQLLLIAAIDERSSLPELLAAAKFVGDPQMSLDSFTPAISAGLVTADAGKVSFRHPLKRDALYAASTPAERVAAHAALANVVIDHDRRVWHRAAATVGLDDEVAEALEASAVRGQQRGDICAAIQALDRAAQLSSDTARAARCLIRAAELAFEIGWPKIVIGLLQRAEKLDLSPRDRIKLKWYREATVGSVSGAEALIEIAHAVKTKDDADLALELLTLPAAKRTWWIQSGERVCNNFIAAIESAGVWAEDDPRFLFVCAITSPIDRGAFVLDGARRLIGTLGDVRHAEIMALAASLVGDHQLAERFADIAERPLRSAGRLTLLTHVMALKAWTSIHLARRDAAIACAEEAVRLGLETDQPTYVAAALGAAATMAALGGDEQRATGLCDDAERITEPLGILLSEVTFARGMTAFTTGDYGNAYRLFRRIFDPEDIGYQRGRHCWFIGDLAEAAAQSGHRDEAIAMLAGMEHVAKRTPAPHVHAAMHHARAILADENAAEPLFETALSEGAVQSPFTRARLQLAFGAWLRRERRTREGRDALFAAMEAFDSLGALPWSERTRQELRASGVLIERRAPERREQLTPQELQIALMAAKGLSNREIGLKLYLSPRTVGSHLYRIFPKLEITSRYELRGALDERILLT